MKCIAIATLTNMDDVNWHIPRVGFATFFVNSAIKPFQDEIEEFLVSIDDNSQHVILKDSYYLHIQRCFNAYCVIVTDEQLSPLQLVYLTRAVLVDKIAKEEVARHLPDYATDQKLKVIQHDLDETRQQMLHNIERLLQRGEQIEQLVEKTEALQAHSLRFEHEAKELNRCWPKGCTII